MERVKFGQSLDLTATAKHKAGKASELQAQREALA